MLSRWQPSFYAISSSLSSFLVSGMGADVGEKWILILDSLDFCQPPVLWEDHTMFHGFSQEGQGCCEYHIAQTVHFPNFLLKCYLYSKIKHGPFFLNDAGCKLSCISQILKYNLTLGHTSSCLGQAVGRESGFHISQAGLELTCYLPKDEDDLGLLIFPVPLPECQHAEQTLYQLSHIPSPASSVFTMFSPATLREDLFIFHSHRFTLNKH